ncbi:MAG: hypothetical protein R3E96_06135 [Planctomycetota bacterium]
MRTSTHSFRLLIVGALFSAPLAAQTVTVTTTLDVVDIDNAGTVADLPGPDGLVSFSEAMIATNNTQVTRSSPDFAIPASQLGWITPAYDGIATFQSNVGFYWRANDEVTIDGTAGRVCGGYEPKWGRDPIGGQYLLSQRRQQRAQGLS